MPPRTNAFQKLVYLLKKFAIPGATVDESVMVPHRVTRAAREVDIWVVAPVGGHAMHIAFECTSSVRPADVGWIEEMVGKHRNLPTDKLVLCSEHGFTQQARKLAEWEKAEVLQLDHVDESSIQRALGGAALHVKLTTRSRPERTFVHVRRGTELVRQQVPDETAVFASGGDPLWSKSVGDLMWECIGQPQVLKGLERISQMPQ